MRRACVPGVDKCGLQDGYAEWTGAGPDDVRHERRRTARARTFDMRADAKRWPGRKGIQRTELSRKQRRGVLGEFELECELVALRRSVQGSVASARRLQRLVRSLLCIAKELRGAALSGKADSLRALCPPNRLPWWSTWSSCVLCCRRLGG